MKHFGHIAAALLVLCGTLTAEDLLVLAGVTGIPGGTLVYGQRTEPKTLNPAVSADNASREVIHRLTADLIHINRLTQQTEPALAKSWTVSPDGLRYVLDLRRGVRFSDGQPFDASDVIFSFAVYLDPNVHSIQRDLLIIDGKPIAVRKLDPYRVEFDLPMPYAAAERLFDGFAILPRHLLEKPYREGRLPDVWGLRTPPSEMAGLGPFRLKEYAPGHRIVLARNPYYWKTDRAGNRLPYMNEADFIFAGSEDAQVMRFRAGESDVLSRIAARNFAVLEKDASRRGYLMRDAGPGMEYNSLLFNLNETQPSPSHGGGRQSLLHNLNFRRAISLAIDRDAIVRLVYLGHAASLGAPVPRANRLWINAALTPPAKSLPKAKELLAAERFSRAADGTLRDPAGRPAEFSLITSSGNPERVQMATLIQDDLKQLGIQVHVTPLDLPSLLDRVLRTRDYDACLLTLQSADADPTPDMNIWLSSAANHLWNPGQKTPATPWEAEIDTLMRRQMVTRNYARRKQMFDRVQALVMQNLPLIPLVDPDVLVGARTDLANFRPAVLDHYTLWNIEELSWRRASGNHQ